MNQNNLNNETKLISPEKVESANNMSREELQQTQVINLKDVQEAARIEKHNSKKPAIIVAVVGIAFLLFGSSFQIITAFKEKKEAESIIEQRKEEEAAKKSYLNCNQTKINNNGVDSVYSFSYYFEDNELIKETRILSSAPTPGDSKGPTEIKKQEETYKKYLNQSSGYNIVLNKTDTGFSITTEIDYQELEPTKLNKLQKDFLITRVEHELGISKNAVKEDMEQKEFICK